MSTSSSTEGGSEPNLLFGERKVVFQILLDGAEPCDAGTTQLSSPVCRRGGQQDPLGICVVIHAHNVPK